MNRRHRIQPLFAALIGFGLIASSATSAHCAEKSAVLDAFAAHVKSLDSVDAAVKQRVLDSLAEARTEDEPSNSLLSAALSRLYPQLETAHDHLGDEDYAKAVAVLQPLAENKDPFLAAEAAFLLARAYVVEERYEKALPHLVLVTEKAAERTLSGGPALFLKAIAESYLLQRGPAIDSLEEFLAAHPDAPERMRVAATRKLALLRQIDDGSIGDIQMRMDYARRRLALEYSKGKTRDEQDRVVSMLDKLIKKAEEEEAQKCKDCQGQGKGQGKGKGKGQGKGRPGGKPGGKPGAGSQGTQGGGGAEETLPPDAESKKTADGPASSFGRMRNADKEFKKLYKSIEREFSKGYEDQINQYFKRIQEVTPETSE